MEKAEESSEKQNQNQENMRICQKCQEDRKLHPQSLCLSCVLLNMERPPGGLTVIQPGPKPSQEQLAKWAKEAEIYSLGSLKAVDEFTLDRFKVLPKNAAAVSIAKSFSPKRDNLYIWGECGTGKTHLSVAIGRKFLNESKIFFRLPELLRTFRMLEPENEEKLIDTFAHRAPLIIDDIGIGRATDFGLQIIYEIIERRITEYRNGLIVTSNLSLDQLSERFQDDRIPSRLAGICKVVHLSGADGRLK